MSGAMAHFLTLIEAPGGWSLEQVMGLLVEVGAVSAEAARGRSLRSPPCLVGLCTEEIGRLGVEGIVRAGGDAMCPGLAEVVGHGGTRKIKHFEVEPGYLVGELWRGGAVGIALGDVQVLVRGDVRTMVHQSAVRGSIGTGLDALYTAEGAVTRALNDAQQARSKKIVGVSAKLDIHTRDGAVYQLDGDKFGYLVLGDMKAQGDVTNMDRTLELLEHVCGNAVSDRLFSQFKAPAQIGRFRIPGMKINNDDPGFAFYSRWIAMVYRHVAGWSVGR